MMTHLDVLRGKVPLLDVRAESEFVQGHVAGSVNLPILNDSERIAVGTAYKTLGHAAATALGHRLVSGETKDQRIQAWRDFVATHPNARLTCWRGGQRSAIAQHWLGEIGTQVERMTGGYKVLRNLALTELDKAADSQTGTKQWWVLAGKTGTAKTVMIHNLSQSIDLEGLAHHRGSAFGAASSPQPSVASFENALAAAYLNHSGGNLVLEDESRTIGRVAVPEPWHLRMQSSAVVLVESDLDTRAAHIEQEYVDHALVDQSHDELLQQYLSALSKIQRRLGGARHQEMVLLITQAFQGQRQHQDWISYLLNNYYDPMYQYQLEKKIPRMVFKGAYSEVKEFLQSRANNTKEQN